jgi:hypothetical protein
MHGEGGAAYATGICIMYYNNRHIYTPYTPYTAYTHIYSYDAYSMTGIFKAYVTYFTIIDTIMTGICAYVGQWQEGKRHGDGVCKWR